MEQQSISVAKAGICCTLPTRTSVIAAANPAGGHYKYRPAPGGTAIAASGHASDASRAQRRRACDGNARCETSKSKTVSENLKMGSPLLSRFDLIFILVDKPDARMDKFLSEHVMAVCPPALLGHRRRP